MSTLRVACGQLCSSSNLLGNAKIVVKLIHKAIAEGAEVLFLPEAADYISRDAAHSMNLANTSQEKFISVIQNELKLLHLLSKKSINVSVGVHEPSNSDSTTGSADASGLKKVQNNLLWIDQLGEITQRYQKIHLFDINITDGPILKESNSVEPGKKVLEPFPVSKGSNFNVGYGICYDIRFPELCLRLRKLGAHIITYPSAFTTKTGQAHWQALGRARAIDLQTYVIMAAQSGEHDVNADLKLDGASGTKSSTDRKKRVSYGNSVIFDPWGNLLAQAKKFDDDVSGNIDEDGDYYELIVADLDLDSLETIRRDMPLLEHRRPDVFGYEI